MKPLYITLRYAIALLFLLVSTNISKAQFINVAAYPFTSSSGTLTYITGGTAVPNILGDDRTEQSIPIGFTFYYAGVPYTQLSACSNGWLSLGNSSSTTFSNTEANMNTISPALMPLFDDLTGGGSNSVASYITTGVAPNRVFTFEWKNWSPLSDQTVDVTIQVKLYEGTANAVEFLYKNEAGGGALSSATIGLSGNVTGDYQLLNTSGATPTVNTSSFVSGIGRTPASDQSYMWDNGPICDQPLSLTVNGLNSQSVTVGWTHPATSGALNYEYYIDKQAAVSIPTTTSTTTGNTITENGLTPSTTYWLHIRRLCSSNNISRWDAISFTTFPECSVPQKIVVSAIDSNSATFSWGGVRTAVNYEYVIDNSKNDPAPGTVTTATLSNALSLTGLQPGTVYYVHVRSLCAGADSSKWLLDSFYVPRPCRAPQVTISNISTSQGVASWLSVLTAKEYEYAVTTGPNPPLIGTKWANQSILLPYLNDGSTYYVHVRTFCEDRNVKTNSKWTTIGFDTYPLSASTLSGSTHSISVYPNPTANVLNIEVEGVVGENAHIQLVDLTGKVLKKMPVDKNSSSIDLSAMPSGVYMLQYSDDKRNEIIKVSKQ